MVKVRVQPLYSMASSTSHDFFCQEANTLYLLCVLIIKGLTSLGPHTRPACNQAPLEMLIKKIHGQTCACIFFTPCLGPRITWCNPRPLIGRERSREQSDDVLYANESRDPQTQYPIVFPALWLVRTWSSPIDYYCRQEKNQEKAITKFSSHVFESPTFKGSNGS